MATFLSLASQIRSEEAETGQVWFPKDAPWLDTLLHELLAFPNARYDDQIDSVSQFLRWAEARYQSPRMACGDPFWPVNIWVNGRRITPEPNFENYPHLKPLSS